MLWSFYQIANIQYKPSGRVFGTAVSSRVTAKNSINHRRLTAHYNTSETVKNIGLIQKKHLELQKMHSEKYLNVLLPSSSTGSELKTHHPFKDALSMMKYLANYFPEMATQLCQNSQNMI